MEKKMTFNYFYGTEADQFSFYRIPKALFTDSYFKDLSSDAKILYGLMLDRMSLSIKNQWFDDKNRAYIYFSIEDIMELLNCGRNKAINFADDFVAGFQYKSEAERYYKELKERMEKFGLELESSKSRLIEFGRFAEQNRRAKGEHKPETFDFLGFTFYCTLIFWMMTKGKMQSFLKKHFMRKKSGSTDACTAGK